jgi:thiol-disulfide isomerase/thioredoxin
VKVRPWLLLCTALVLLGACGSAKGLDARLTDPGPVQEGGIPAGGPSAGQHLPTDAYERLDGGTATFAGYQGKPLVVNVWASWCGPCVQEMPAFERVHQDVKDRVAFVGLDEAKALAAKTGVTYDLLYDPKGGFVAATGAVSLPSTFFVDSNGKVVSAKTGAFDEAALRAKLTELFAS